MLENATPMVVRRLQVARGTGGTGAHRGGDGVLKEIEFLAPSVVHLLADRRTRGPYGLHGGGAGACGRDELVRGGVAEPIAGRVRLEVARGDRLRIRTPGGGGYGAGPHPATP